MRRGKLMKSFAQFLTACAISSPVFANNLKEYYYGDSIAVGYGGKSAGSRREGASPEEILSYIERDLRDNPEKFRGRTVNISTGVSNNPRDFRSIERQLARLQKSGAIVNVLGAAKGRYDGENERLASLSSQYGATFKGGFVPGRDGIHPRSYASYDTGAKPRKTSSSRSTPAPKLKTSDSLASLPTPTPKRVLSKLKGVEGTGVGKDFVARKWTSAEKTRYKKYGGK